MTDTIVHWLGLPAAFTDGDRIDFASWMGVHEDDHPHKRWVGAMAAYAREVAAGRRPGPYCEWHARCFAREHLLGDVAGVVALAHLSDGEFAEVFNIPLEEVAHARAYADALTG